MTREEAIYIIDNLKPTNTKSSFDAYVVGKAINMAIEALSAETCEDTISRSWLKEAIHNFYYGSIYPRTEEDIQAYIDAAPSVTPKQKMGRWIDTMCEDSETYRVYKCSECGQREVETPESIGKFKFCPICGAKMAESEE